jgi:hypothetical protein
LSNSIVKSVSAATDNVFSANPVFAAPTGAVNVSSVPPAAADVDELVDVVVVAVVGLDEVLELPPLHAASSTAMTPTVTPILIMRIV